MRTTVSTARLLFVCLLFALALIGCAQPEQSQSAAPATAPATETSAAPDTAAAATGTDAAAAATAATETAAAAAPMALDAQISAKLVEAFGDDAKAIHITIVDGKVTLTGKVAARSTQELAEEVVRFFPDVKGVDNQLAAETDRKLGKGQLRDETADAKLESAAKGALAAEVGEYAKNIEVEAADGAVALRGTVPDEARLKLALDSMSRVKDCTKVVNLLRVGK